MHSQSRRRFLVAAAAAAIAAHARVSHAQETIPEVLQPVVKGITGGAPIQQGRVTMEIPRLADNAHAVPLKVAVASPMTESDHVRSIHVLSERNPRPVVAAFHLNPQSGRAEITTRVRLNGTQRLLVIAAMSDGSHWAASAVVDVTSNACLDET